MTADASIKHLTPYPEEIDTNLDPLNGNANGCKFNRLGSMVAVSANDGRVAIMDYITGGNIKAWTAHARTVTSLSWSRDSRRLLTAATDGTVSLWNIEDTTRAANQYAFEGIGSPLTATFNPRNDNQILVFSPNFRSFVPLLLEFTADGEKRIQLACDFPDDSDDAFGAAAFDRRGEYVICGSAKGRIAVFDAKTGAMKRSVKQGSPNQQIKSIVVTRRGNYILTNSQLYIRCYELDQILSCPEGETIEPLQKFADTINKTSWKSICTSGEGDYVCAANTKAHCLSIWERNTGSLVKILNGTKGVLVGDVQWHPSRSVIYSVAHGAITVFTQAHVENWSAFAPDFTELEENCKYVERENEFDLEDEDADDIQAQEKQTEEEEEIDVESVQRNAALCSSDEEDVDDFRLPVDPEVDQPEEPTLYQYERKQELMASVPRKRRAEDDAAPSPTEGSSHSSSPYPCRTLPKQRKHILQR